jgi:hypothetical protein
MENLQEKKMAELKSMPKKDRVKRLLHALATTILVEKSKEKAKNNPNLR